MKLNKPGIYRIVGEHFELLANIIGEVPCLRITGALNMNDLVQKGKFTILDEESIEIQDVISNPDKFIFLEYDYSEICQLPSYRASIRGAKMPSISDKEYQEFVNRYLEDTRVNGRGPASTKHYIMKKKDWSMAQANVVVMHISNYVKHYRHVNPLSYKSCIH